MNFKIIENGKEINCDVISIFRDENNDRNYVVYTDGTEDKDGELEVYASRYTEEDGKYILKPVEYEYEWDLIDNMIESEFRGNE